MTERRIPSEMMPEPIKTEAQTTVKVTARVENTQYGICPVCGDSMIQTMAAGHRVHACVKDRVVMPVREEDPNSAIPV